MKAIILARVSDKEQDSNEAQINRVSEYVKFKDLQVYKNVEIEESSTKGDRKKFQEVIKEIEQSKETIALVVDTVDRLQRSFKESVQLDDLRKKGKIEIHFYRENLVINQNSNSAELLRWDMAVMFARSYVLQLSDNVKRKQEQLLLNHIYPTQPPYGYKRVPIESGKTEIVLDEFKSGLVRQAYELYATKSYSMDLLRNKINKDYGLKWSKGFIDKVLKNQFYCGVMTWNNKQYTHKYDQVINSPLFEEVQQIKAGFNKNRYKLVGKLPYLYRGILRCGHCGLAITPEKHKGHVYYHCTQYNGKHKAEWLREEDITEQLGSIFKRIQMPEWVLQKITETLKTSHDGKSEFREAQYKELTKEHELYSKRLEKLYLDKLDGSITVSEYDKYQQSFREKVAEIDTRLSILQEADDNYYITVTYLLELANRAYELFKSSEVQERRQLIKLVLSNLRVEGKEVRFEAIKPFDTLLEYADSQLWLPLVDMFIDKNIEIACSLKNIELVLSDFNI